MSHPTRQSLIRDCIRDQLNDYRCAIKYANQYHARGRHDKAEAEEEYGFKCLRQALLWYRQRHRIQLNRYGWPL